MTDLSTIIARLEAVQEGSAELDEAIWGVVSGRLWSYHDTINLVSPPRYTTMYQKMLGEFQRRAEAAEAKCKCT